MLLRLCYAVCGTELAYAATSRQACYWSALRALVRLLTFLPRPYTLGPTPYTLAPSPYTLAPTPYTLAPTP
eukprot:525739-Rhodomonas_salina.2